MLKGKEQNPKNHSFKTFGTTLMTEKELEQFEFLESVKLITDTCTQAVIIGIDKDGEIMRAFMNYDRKKIVEMCQDVIDERQD